MKKITLIAMVAMFTLSGSLSMAQQLKSTVLKKEVPTLNAEASAVNTEVSSFVDEVADELKLTSTQKRQIMEIEMAEAEEKSLNTNVSTLKTTSKAKPVKKLSSTKDAKAVLSGDQYKKYQQLKSLKKGTQLQKKDVNKKSINLKGATLNSRTSSLKKQ